MSGPKDHKRPVAVDAPGRIDEAAAIVRFPARRLRLDEADRASFDEPARRALRPAAFQETHNWRNIPIAPYPTIASGARRRRRRRPSRLIPFSPPLSKSRCKTRVATGGSCFAKEIAQKLKASGYHYYLAEQPPEGMSAAEAERRNYSTHPAATESLHDDGAASAVRSRLWGVEAGARALGAPGGRPHRRSLPPEHRAGRL